MTAAPEARTKLIAAVHAEAKRRGLDEETRRALMTRVTGKSSAKDMTGQELVKVIEAIKGPRGRRAEDHRPQAAKLTALWLSLWHLGAVEDRSTEAMAAFVRRHTGIEALRWNTGADLATAIDCLRGWCRRVGYDPKPHKSAVETPMKGRFEPGLIQAQWALLAALGAFDVDGHHGRLDLWLGRLYGISRVQDLAPTDAEDAVKTLGAWIRKTQALRNEAGAA